MEEKNIFDKIKLSMDLDDPRRKNVELMEKVVKTIPTEAGRKYALSKLLNNPEYGLTDPSTFKNQKYTKDIEDAWSLKHQEDYTPPDVEKVLEKRNKEQAENFWNWDSDEHWTRKGTYELKRQAKDAGYADLAGYLDKVREIQTNKDRHKASEKYGFNYWGSLLFPRLTEAVQRGEDPSLIKDIGLDAIENAFYLLNPLGRVFRAGAQGVKMGKKLGGAANVVDVLANPLIMESIDAKAYGDKDNTDRKDFSEGDVLLGTGINLGMNKVMPYLFKNRGKLLAPVNKSKAQMLAEEEAKKATQEANKILEDGSSRKATTLMKDIVEDELQRQGIRENFPSRGEKRDLRDLLREELAEEKVIEPRKTKFSERLLGDLDKDDVAIDYISNKTGDKISEDPKLTRQLLTRAAREYVPFAGQFISDLARDYYNSKDKNVEQDKINQAIKLLGRRR